MPDDDAYTPRFTSVERVLRAMRLGGEAQFAEGTDFYNDILDSVEATEEFITEELGDQVTIAAADASAMNLCAGYNGLLHTGPMAAEPDSVRHLAGRTDTTGSLLSADDWRISRPARGAMPACHLLGDVIARGAWYRVEARWGFSAVPAVVKRVALLRSIGFYKRERDRVGVDTDAGDVGDMAIPALSDYDARALLKPLKRRVAGMGL